ncbi:MAG TPA: homoserine dehydrogenase [Thermoanaerobaculia bacterium]|nr:homoserine dehydrogenase [Thermoanaerobaculia bacterium]
MHPTSPIHILKLASPSLPVHEVYRAWRSGSRVVVVTPVLGPTADDLLKRAEQLGLPPDREALAALHRAGLPATLLDPSPAASVLQALANGIVVVPGGSDLTAPALARELGAPCSPLPHQPARPPRSLLTVALLGCGTVGGGVLERLLARPDLFEVTGVAVRDLGLSRGDGVPRHLLTDGPEALVAQGPDVVVELIGGREPARSLIVRALEQGSHVVTANKALLAEEIGRLSALAVENGVSLLYSASVGGALPALETVWRVAAGGPIRAIRGVLNGTSTFVLDRRAEGLSLEAAVTAAQLAGFAEANPTLDLDGSDAAQKLALLAREAFGDNLRWHRIPRRGIDDVADHVLAEAARWGAVVRLVATCELLPEGLRASVRPVELDASDFLARTTTGAGNALRIERVDGSVAELSAAGAGRWPTTEAVMADLHDLVDLPAAHLSAALAKEVTA